MHLAEVALLVCVLRWDVALHRGYREAQRRPLLFHPLPGGAPTGQLPPAGSGVRPRQSPPVTERECQRTLVAALNAEIGARGWSRKRLVEEERMRGAADDPIWARLFRQLESG